MDKYFLHVKVIFICLFLFTFCHVTYTCAGFSGQGYTYPPRDIFIEYNTSTPLELTCVITDKTLIKTTPNISSKLYYKRENDIVPAEKIIRLNDTSIKLVEENLDKMADLYSCMLNDSTICLNTVVVGTKPQRVNDFKCLGMNYENLTCSWTPPYNYVPTTYNLSYTFKERSGTRPTDCNVTDDKTKKKKMCFWGLQTSPHYRQVYKEYIFKLKAHNRFGTSHQEFLFDHWKNILSGPPENLTCINSTTSSLFLSWKVPMEMVPFSNGLEHRILYQCGFRPKIWQDGGLQKTVGKPVVYFNLTGLEHAHDLCDIRVAIRVRGADTEEMWSANASITELTSSTIPGAPPRVNIGSFQTEITSHFRDIYVYWQQIPNEIKNADHFQYLISVEGSNAKSVELTNSYARFTNMSLNTDYKFIIKSKNSEGESKESAILEVPANDKMISEPVSFKKVAFENGLFKLSWGKPKKGAEYVQNYTLFWCIYDKERPYQCAGYLNWTEVPASTTEYNITVPENTTIQVAVSANNATSSSGMIWAACTLIHNKSITKIKEIWISSVGSNFIDLRWALGCADASDNVAGYIIYYCPRRSKEPACQKQLNLTLNNADAVYAHVGNLIPYTTYRLTVSVIDKHGTQSHESEALYNTTYEGVPSEPYNLNVTDVTNSSISLTWEPPKEPNGFLRPYNVYFNNNVTQTSDNKTSWILTNLDDNTEYSISVSACTLHCSRRSKHFVVKTKVGRPVKIDNTFAKPENNTLVVSWAQPYAKNKPDFYELKVTYMYNQENQTLPIFSTRDTKFYVPCEKEGIRLFYHYSVRAVNRDGDTNYTGPWSNEEKASCSQTIYNNTLVWIAIVVGCFFALIAMLFSGKKLYIQWHKVTDVEFILPTGLDPQIDTNWTQSKPKINLSDEERLIHHKSYINPGDSSGCSSGQESVASDSGSSIASSTSDSGTEQPRTPTDEESKILLTNLNVNTLKLSENQPYNNGYSMFGISDPVNNSEIEMNCIAKSNSVESPYLTCDQITKPIDEARSVNNTYVQFNNTQEKNPPYVMAANKNVIISNLFYPNVIPTIDERAYVQVADVNQTTE